MMIPMPGQRRKTETKASLENQNRNLLGELEGLCIEIEKEKQALAKEMKASKDLESKIKSLEDDVDSAEIHDLQMTDSNAEMLLKAEKNNKKVEQEFKEL